MIISLLKAGFILFVAYFPISALFLILFPTNRESYGFIKRCHFSQYRKFKNASKELGGVKMSYERIKALYNLNPQRWSRDSAYTLHFYECPCFYYLTNEKEKIYVYFSYRDYLRLMYNWSFNHENNSKQEDAYKLKAIAQSAQTDIDKLKSEAKEQINEATETINKVYKNLKF